MIEKDDINHIYEILLMLEKRITKIEKESYKSAEYYLKLRNEFNSMREKCKE